MYQIERLDFILANRVLDRAIRGLYRSYIEENEQLAYVRGQINVLEASRLLRRFPHQVHSSKLAESHRCDAYVNCTVEGENVLEIVPDSHIVTVSIVALNGS